MNINERIKQQLNEHNIVLYMKGTPESPMCGFSSKAAQILKLCGAQYFSVNVLEDSEIREGIKEYGNWPTIPQLYVKGKLIGGSDIMAELYESGELKELL
jgi:monothiol glutaredoxin